MRVVGIVDPLPHWGSVFEENSFYRAPEVNACARCPQQRYATGEQGKVQGRDRLEVVEGSCRYRAHRDQYSGKIRFIDNPGV